MSFPCLRRAVPPIALLLVAMVAHPPRVAAQPPPGVSLHLRAQPPWHGPRDPLAIEVEVVNSSASTVEGFRLQVTSFDVVRSRSALHASFDGEAGFQTDILVKTFDRPVPPGASTIVAIDDPVASLDGIAQAEEAGIYPLTIALFDAAGAEALDELTTPLLFQPAPAEVPLNLVVVVPLHELPARDPDGAFVQERGAWPLEEALAPNGWLEGMVAALESSVEPPVREDRGGRKRGRKRAAPEPTPPLAAALAPTPRLLDELADMAGGYDKRVGATLESAAPSSAGAGAAKAAIDRLRALLAHPGVQPLVVPYGFPDMPTILRRWPGDPRLAEHLTESKLVLEEVLGIDPAGAWVLPPAGRLDAASLEQLQLLAGNETFVSADSLEGPADPAVAGCPEDSPSFVCPIVLRTGVAQTTGYVSDEGIEARLADVSDGGDTRLDIQNFFAETAMVHAERPGVAGRVLQATVPALWHPSPRFARLLLRGLAAAPWLRTITPEAGLELNRAPEPRRIVDSAPPLRGEPDDAFFASIDAAESQIDHLQSMDAPPGLLEPLRRNLLVAQSRSWWRDPFLLTRGADYAPRSIAAADDTFGRIRVESVDQITLTSREGEIRLELENRTNFTAEVEIRLSSVLLAAEDEERTVRLAPAASRELTIDATADSSGSFELNVFVLTPDGHTIATKTIEIRSTEFNKIALGITLGALAFLILFYVLRATRRTRKHSGASA